FSVARRDAYNLNDSPFGNWEIELLNKQLEVTATVTTVSPLSQTDGHEFLIAANGDYVMLSYYDDEPRDFSDHGGSETEGVADSVIQRRGAGAGGTSSFTWNTWDHRDVLQWGNDCKVGLFLRGSLTWPPGYAHINGVQVLADGDYVASSRGCAQVLRIDGTSGAVEWKLGGTAPPASSTTEHLELVEHSDTSVVEEFCGQHHVTLTSSGTVVMYDNGVQCLGARKDTTPFSRAVEYDISSGTQAEYEREYRLPAAQGYFPYRGGVHVLDGFGGSVHWLISWGGSAEGRTVALNRTIAVSEVDPATGTAHLQVNMRTGSEDAWTYRAYRIADSEVDIPLNLP
ncbi:MAG: aryl-sulfate sulfotransferase, partial [Spirochaetaceae bacterium]|nr:aryl-sulfate sulfotransferase [Spirochaetaceae bacterium]